MFLGSQLTWNPCIVGTGRYRCHWFCQGYNISYLIFFFFFGGWRGATLQTKEHYWTGHYYPMMCNIIYCSLEMMTIPHMVGWPLSWLFSIPLISKLCEFQACILEAKVSGFLNIKILIALVANVHCPLFHTIFCRMLKLVEFFLLKDCYYFKVGYVFRIPTIRSTVFCEGGGGWINTWDTQ